MECMSTICSSCFPSFSYLVTVIMVEVACLGGAEAAVLGYLFLLEEAELALLKISGEF